MYETNTCFDDPNVLTYDRYPSTRKGVVQEGEWYRLMVYTIRTSVVSRPTGVFGVLQW